MLCKDRRKASACWSLALVVTAILIGDAANLAWKSHDGVKVTSIVPLIIAGIGWLTYLMNHHCHTGNSRREDIHFGRVLLCGAVGSISLFAGAINGFSELSPQALFAWLSLALLFALPLVRSYCGSQDHVKIAA